jgi:uncharacterized protein YjbI with pentapeptide repeats
VISPETGDPITLDQAVRSFIESHPRGAVEIVGARQTGKTTALEHLAAELHLADDVVLLDEPDAGDVRSRIPYTLVIFTSCTRRDRLADASFVLAPWTDDDIIEYLLAVHPARCRSVMQRIRNDPFRSAVVGEPHLWHVILDEMAWDDSLSGIREALRSGVRRSVGESESPARVREFCLATFRHDEDVDWAGLQSLIAEDGNHTLLGLVRHRAVRLLLAAEEVVELFAARNEDQLTAVGFSGDLIRETGHLVHGDGRAAQRIRRLLRRSTSKMQPVAASILHAAGVRWQPGPKMLLDGAILEGVQWQGANLSHCRAARSRWNRADLSRANLDHTVLAKSRLCSANLHKCNLGAARLNQADLSRADLSDSNGKEADFHRACLSGANLERGDFVGANFSQADLTGARLCEADLSHANLSGAVTDRTDFSNANLFAAVLTGNALRNAVISGTCFVGARMMKCDLEYMRLVDVDFTDADLSESLLTGTVMPNTCFSGARLRGSAMADVHWENADLRGADLRGCQFHMGSSRSGLVGSPYPGHGSRTGFYTDSYDERYYHSPEEIRKANLCGADLRGADVRDTDFYLVDLRGALYDRAQAEHFRRCDAILDDWV